MISTFEKRWCSGRYVNIIWFTLFKKKMLQSLRIEDGSISLPTLEMSEDLIKDDGY
jgi:hypothetical protein